jgi:hypothetical protein
MRGSGRSGGSRGGGRTGGGRSSGGRSGSGGRGGGLGLGGRGGGRSGVGGGGFYSGGPGFFGRTYTYIGSRTAFLIIIVAIILYIFPWSPGSVTKSSYRREPLPGGIVNETDYLRDDPRWIARVTMVKNSLRYFYKKTGVQPYLWITENINGSKDTSPEEMDEAMEKLYDDTFTDEGHLIVLFFEPRENEYEIRYLAGAAAKTVIDEEASEILFDYLEKYYYSTSLKDDEYFSRVFTKSADRIMSVTMDTKLVIALIFGGLALVAILSVVFAAMLKHRRLKRQQDIELLNTDVNKIGEDNASRLARKYEEHDEPPVG